MLDEPRVVDLVRRRDVVGDEDHRGQLLDPLADPVRALQLVEHVGDGQLVVGVLDLVERRLLELLRLARVDLDPVLLAELLRALQDVLAKVALRALRRLVLLAAEGLRRLDLPRVLLAD